MRNQNVRRSSVLPEYWFEWVELRLIGETSVLWSMSTISLVALNPSRYKTTFESLSSWWYLVTILMMLCPCPLSVQGHGWAWGGAGDKDGFCGSWCIYSCAAQGGARAALVIRLSEELQSSSCMSSRMIEGWFPMDFYLVIDFLCGFVLSNEVWANSQPSPWWEVREARRLSLHSCRLLTELLGTWHCGDLCPAVTLTWN